MEAQKLVKLVCEFDLGKVPMSADAEFSQDGRLISYQLYYNAGSNDWVQYHGLLDEDASAEIELYLHAAFHKRASKWNH